MGNINISVFLYGGIRKFLALGSFKIMMRLVL